MPVTGDRLILLGGQGSPAIRQGGGRPVPEGGRMTIAVAGLLSVQGLLFLFWAMLMFRTLFRLRRRAVADCGQAFPGLGATLRAWRAFLTEPGWRRDRRLLGALTLALVAMTVAVPLLWPADLPGQGLLPPPPRR